MSDPYPSNSRNPARAEPEPAGRPKQEPIVTNVKVRKKSIYARFADRGRGIWGDILFEVVGPYIRDMGADVFYSATDRMFYGNSTGGRTRTGGGGRPSSKNQQHVSQAGYVITDYSSQYQNSGPSSPYEVGGNAFDFSVYVFDNYAQGREMIDRLTHIINGYGVATANDLLDLLGKSGDHTGEKYGWGNLNDLAGAEVRRARGGAGYYLDIPDAKPLKR